MAELVERPRRADLADEVYANREQTTEQMSERFNDVGLRDLSSRVIELSEMIRVLRDPQNDEERGYRDDLRTYLSRDASFGSVNDALERFEEERLSMFRSLSERLTPDNVGEIGDVDSQLNANMLQVVDSSFDNPAYAGDSVMLDDLRELLLSPRPTEEDAVFHGPTENFRGMLLNFDTPVRFYPYSDGSVAVFPSGVEFETHQLSMFMEGEMDGSELNAVANEVLTGIAYAMAYVQNNKNDFNNPAELNGDQGAIRRADQLADLLERAVASNHGIRESAAWRNGIDALRDGHLEEGLSYLTDMGELDPIFDYMQNLVIVEPAPYGARVFTVGATFRFELNEEALRRLLMQGDQISNTVAEAVFVQVNYIRDAIRLRTTPMTLDRETMTLVRDTERESTSSEAYFDSVEATVGFSWLRRAGRGRPLRITTYATAGYTGINDAGDATISLPNGDEIVAENATPNSFYIGTTGLEIEFLQREDEPTRIFRIVNTGIRLIRPISLADGEYAVSLDHEAYVTLAFEGRNGSWLFGGRLRGGIGMSGHISGETMEHNPGVAVSGQAEPFMRYLFGSGYVEVATPVSVDYRGGSDRYGGGTDVTIVDIGAQVSANFPRLGIAPNIRGSYVRGFGPGAPWEHGGRLDVGIEVTPTRWGNARDAVPVRTDLDSAPITSGDIPTNLADAYMDAIGHAEGSTEGLRRALQSVPRSNRLRAESEFNDAIFALESDDPDLAEALRNLDRIGAFREIVRERRE